MFDWLFEGRSAVYVFLAFVALGLLVFWWQTRRRAVLYGLGAAVLLAGLYFLLDRLVETDREQIVRRLNAMAEGVRRRNADQILANVSDQFRLGSLDKATFRSFVERVLRQGWVDDLAVWEFVFPADYRKPYDYEDAGGVRHTEVASVQFQAKPSGTASGNAAYYLCKAHFLRDPDGQWRLKDFQIFNPFIDTNKPLGLPGMP